MPTVPRLNSEKMSNAGDALDVTLDTMFAFKGKVSQLKCLLFACKELFWRLLNVYILMQMRSRDGTGNTLLEEADQHVSDVEFVHLPGSGQRLGYGRVHSARLGLDTRDKQQDGPGWGRVLWLLRRVVGMLETGLLRGLHNLLALPLRLPISSTRWRTSHLFFSITPTPTVFCS